MTKTPSAGANVASRLAAFLRTNTGAVVEFAPRPEGKLIWLHLPSDFAQGPMQELCKMLGQQFENHNCLVTVNDPSRIHATSNMIAVPAEYIGDVDQFLNHWQPDILLWADADLRPKLLQRFNERKKPMFMFNMPELNFTRRGLRRMQALTVALFDAIQATNSEAAARLISLGFPSDKVTIVPPIGEIAQPLPDNEPHRREMAKRLGMRPVWCAANMPLSECALIADAHHQARKSFPTAALVIVPENPDDAAKIAQILVDDNWKVTIDVQDTPQDRQSEIVVVTRPADLGVWLRLSSVAVMGGALNGPLSCDPFLATALGSAVIGGPVCHPFEEKYRQLEHGDGLIKLDDVKDLAAQLIAALAPDRSAELATNAWAVGSDSIEPLMKVIAMITPSLTPEGL